MNTSETDPNPAFDYLLEQGLLERSTPAMRAVIGCISCRWLTRLYDSTYPATYGGEIMACTGLPSGTVYPMLQKFVDREITVPILEEGTPTELGRKPRVFYVPSESAIGEGFLSKIQPPGTCGLEELK